MKAISIIAALLAIALPAGCRKHSPSTIDCDQTQSRRLMLEDELTDYISDKSARIGIAVIINESDTLSINGEAGFPMMSVFKFPLALAVAQWADNNGLSLDHIVSFDPDDLIPDTYSPMLLKYGKNINSMSLRELLQWTLIESDNNTADILLGCIGGPANATRLLKDVAGDVDITIGASEEDMHDNPYDCHLNGSTPLAMASLFNRFDHTIRLRSNSLAEIADMLVGCRTGADRLAAPLPSSAIIAHKTGTGFQLPDGGISALNDCGYIHLPDGNNYSIAVFIADSTMPIDETSAMIADISRLVLNSLQQ